MQIFYKTLRIPSYSQNGKAAISNQYTQMIYTRNNPHSLALGLLHTIITSEVDMKAAFLLTFFFSIIGHNAFAQNFEFLYNLDGQTQSISLQSSSYEEAYSKFAEICFKKHSQNKKISENRGLDIIDACANPRSKKI